MKKFIIGLGVLIGIILIAFFFLNDKKEQEKKTETATECKTEYNDKYTYNLGLCMNKNGTFDIVARVKVKNNSKETWNEMPFQFMPVMFTKENYPVDKSSEIKNLTVKVDGKKVKHSYLLKSYLRVPFKKHVKPGDKREITFSYTLKLSKSAPRLLQTNGNYYLAQWYPMFPVYKDRVWNMNLYEDFGETYHTKHSSFNVQYQLNKGYKLFSTDENDGEKSKGTLQTENVKEFYIAIVKNDSIVRMKKVDGVELRVIANKGNERTADAAIEIGSEAFRYFNEKIGKYPMKQLDIVLTENKLAGNMEYPGIVTAYAKKESKRDRQQDLERMIRYVVVHEIAHQWFYGVVSNDAYNEAWIDEGIAELTTDLYSNIKWGDNTYSKEPYLKTEFHVNKPSNLPLNYYTTKEYGQFIYAMPKNKMWKLFEQHGGLRVGFPFLSQYYETYKYKEVTTKEFVEFTKNYFKLKDDSYFRDWLLLEEN